MTTFSQKQKEWDTQGSSHSDFKEQVCRPITEEDWQALLADIQSKLLLPNQFNSILDVGCGNALILSSIQQNFNSIYGIDYGESMIKNAKKLLPHGHFKKGDAGKLDFENERFDRVLSYSIFHYFPDETYVYNAIDEMIRVTKPGGVILIGDLLDKNHEENIKGNSDLAYEEKLPYILRYSHWTFCDLEKIKAHFENQISKVEILNQPKTFKLSHYRKDLRIWR
jgi:ubiquinone/menaquinone biosynthesis C-methylase UbiE